MKIITILNLLFPEGTLPSNESEAKNSSSTIITENNNIENIIWCPCWPTDVFAFCATVLDRTGLLHYQAVKEKHKKKLSQEYLKKTADLWRQNFVPPDSVVDSWKKIVNKSNIPLADLKRNKSILFHFHFLFKCADEASCGLGWGSESLDSLFDQLVLEKTFEGGENSARNFLDGSKQDYKMWQPPYLPSSFCHMIPPQRAVVTPKSISAEVGYTIRSLSHHLALLEPQPKLKIGWHFAESPMPSTDFCREDHYHILFLPFPYKMAANCIYPAKKPNRISNTSGKKYGYFRLKPTWLPKGDNFDQANKIYNDLIKPLLENARSHSEYVDCIVFPECALTENVADELAKLLVQHERKNGLRLLVTGAISENEKLPKNKALSYFFDVSGEIKHGHTKHHRWKLDVNQTRRYGFSAFPADVNTDWWEEIDVSDRQLPFYAIRQHSCMTVLVCEDLARNDPALPAVRAIGPNLVIALLMDGPQIASRWPARYATVLADDPGSAVLSVTSAAMTDRSNRQESNGTRSVALWKHHSGRTEQLILPPNHHGFLLSLGSTNDEQVTMDNRVDGEKTRRFELMGIEPLKLNTVQTWL